MGQLSGDCFAHGDAPMTVAAAEALIAARVAAVADAETVPLAAACGRVLAADLRAAMPVPPHDNAAVDGYAVHFADLRGDGETVLPVRGRAAAGHSLGRPQPRGEAVRIFTGAMMPTGPDGGPDTVLMQEDCVEDGGDVRIPRGIAQGANRRHAGEDVAAGAVALPAGRRMRPQDVGMAAAIGLAEVPVRRALRAALFSTGDEIRPPGTPLPPGSVYDSNRYIVAALLAGLGVAVDDLGILPDRLDAVAAALAAAGRGHDLVVTTGGMSVGEEDHVRAAVAAAGRIDFWRLAIRPGRPVALGRVGEAIFIGLPGNPVAVMVTFMTLARTIVLARAGATPEPPRAFPVRAAFDHRKKPGRREYLRARLSPGADGFPEVRKFPRESTGILSSMVDSDGLVVLPEAMTDLAAGTLVDFVPFSEMTR
ncbi:MAG: molybdopterin molybdotransferase MoeA [Alphaproteobacteria bacterium]|nr:molybdopterin molybdotransferase MoeA [Alphaproteobacteria bacterium]